MEIRNAKDNGNNTFDCEVNHPVFGWIPFTASAEDVEQSGRDAHASIVSGLAGAVLPYVPPTADEVATQVRAVRDQKLTRFDSDLYRNQFYWDALTQAQRDERLAYRQALLDVPEQDGFPCAVVWADFPTL